MAVIIAGNVPQPRVLLCKSMAKQYPCAPLYKQGLRASSVQFTSPLEFNAIFRDGFTLRLELSG